QIIRIGQEELNPTRGSGVGPAQAIAARRNLEERLDLAIDQESIAQNAIGIEQVKECQAGVGIEYLITQHHGNIELAAGQMEPGGFVSGIKLVEQQVLAHQSLVNILGGKVDPVIVIEQRA